jgi:hypothetical protein
VGRILVKLLKPPPLVRLSNCSTRPHGEEALRGGARELLPNPAPNTRELLAAQKDVPGEKLDHYIKTLRFLSAGRPDLPFLTGALLGAGRAGRAGGKLGP